MSSDFNKPTDILANLMTLFLVSRWEQFILQVFCRLTCLWIFISKKKNKLFFMHELILKIDELKTDMGELLDRVDSYSKDGRNTSHSERIEQMELLENWFHLGQQLKVCKELLEIICNKEKQNK